MLVKQKLTELKEFKAVKINVLNRENSRVYPKNLIPKELMDVRVQNVHFHEEYPIIILAPKSWHQCQQIIKILKGEN